MPEVWLESLRKFGLIALSDLYTGFFLGGRSDIQTMIS